MDVFVRTVSCFGELIAVDAPDAVLSYRELSREADALAARLGSAGIGPGDRVGVYVPSGTAQLYIAILGVLHAGAAYVPVDADDPRARAAAIWEAARVCAMIEEGLRITELARAGGGRARSGSRR